MIIAKDFVASVVKFTIQNVSIKFNNDFDIELGIEDLQYKMFLLNLF